MVSQASQLDCDVNVYFVVPSKYKSENECTEDMWHAYDKCCDHDVSPQWITENNCNKMKPLKNDVFVMEEFKGEVFERLKTFKCSRIVGPRCLLICFVNGEPIPEGTNPVYTTAMRGLCVCASGLTPEIKDHIRQLVEYMGGFFTRQLRNSVTHLVTDFVMSTKYENAAKMQIPIVTKEWVEAVWEVNLKEFVKADDEMFNKYKCPIFMNLIVTSTNLSKRQKEEVKRLINDHGGTFMGPLDGTKVKVLLAPENAPLTEKLKYAMQTDIACLTPGWVYESIEAGYALPFSKFLIKSTKACSTPEKSHVNESLNFSAVSTITCEAQKNNYVDESLATTVTNFSTMDPSTTSTTPHPPNIPILDKLTLNEAKMAGPFLDGCNIYLAGFASNQRDKLNRILNVGSATRLDDISDALTHVLIGDENRAASELKLMKSEGLCPYILTLDWLAESMKLKRPAPEEYFLYKQKSNIPHKNVAEPPPSPLSKKNLQMLQRPKIPPVPSFNISKKVVPTINTDHDLLQQYLQDTVAAESSVQALVEPHNSTVQEKEQKLVDANDTSDGKQSNIPISEASRMSQGSTVSEKIFDGLTFLVIGFSNDDNYVMESIATLGGNVLSYSFTGIPDYGVVPRCGAALKYTVNEIVTDLFIEDCINQEKVVEIMYYHRPLSIAKHKKPLSGCVITLSTYSGAERMYLAKLAEELGAMCQDTFARKTNVERNTYGSTHLICPSPEGSKYNAAVKWKLPAVTAEWLMACAAQLKLVNEAPYLVGETMAPDRPDNDTTVQETTLPSTENEMAPPPVSLPTRQIITPKRLLPHLQGEDNGAGQTPLINKRLSLVMQKTPQSPFHVSTPESPYGQVFKPNPSPDTRKGWVKWVQNFPDLQVEEPPAKRRAPSTPLSELKRQLWQKLKNPATKDDEDANESPTENNGEAAPETPKDVTKSVERNSAATTATPINRKLEYPDENSPLQNNQISLQLAQLEEALTRTPSTPENRYSLSSESARKYNNESIDEMQKCMVKESQPDTVGWEDPGHHVQSRPPTIQEEAEYKDTGFDDDDIEKEMEKQLNNTDVQLSHPPKPKFMLSGIKDRTAYELVIRELGGDVSTDSYFDETATHLLCTRPSRNEKMLCSIAAGKWVLHCMYLRDSEQAGRFLDEERYEWGNPKSIGVISEPSGETEQAIAAAAYRWRLKLKTEPCGAFQSMTALLLTPPEKYDQFKRLIEAGGGTVVQARPPYDTSPSGRKITHCFVNIKQTNQPIDWAMMASKGILCFQPQYLSDHLTATTPLNPRERVLPEFKKYLALLPK